MKISDVEPLEVSKIQVMYSCKLIKLLKEGKVIWIKN